MVFSEIITRLPVADVPFEGVTGYMLRSADGLQVFFHFNRDTVVPMHKHGAQWGVVVAGQIELTIGEEARTYGPGDTYVIARDQMHGATITAGTHIIDFFEEPDRYQPRPSDG